MFKRKTKQNTLQCKRKCKILILIIIIIKNNNNIIVIVIMNWFNNIYKI